MYIFIASVGFSSPSFGLDVNKAAVAPTMLEAFELGREALKLGDPQSASTALEYAADQGHILAQWKLGHMYVKGEGVTQDRRKAFHYFQTIADSYADVPPSSKIASIVSDSFIQMGVILLEGIPEQNIKANPPRGMNLITHAGSYFGNADAQYTIGKVYAEGQESISKNSKKAVRWLRLAARNNHSHAQAYLGQMLVMSYTQASLQHEGMMWLEVANQTQGTKNPWIKSVYEEAKQVVSVNALKTASIKAKNWIDQKIK